MDFDIDGPVFINMPSGERIGVMATQASSVAKPTPGLFWLSGFKSVMTGTKATALSVWASDNAISSCRFDYSGIGYSDNGDFEGATISCWLDQALAVFREFTNGPQVIVGSSMGGWLALLLYKRLAECGEANRVKGLVLIAPAADTTEELMWKNMPSSARTAFEKNGVWYRPSAYGDGDYPITAKLIEDGRRHLILGGKMKVRCPVRILHGDCDQDVPWQHGLRLYQVLRGEDVTFTLIKNGDHRLSTDAEIARLISVIAALVQPAS